MLRPSLATQSTFQRISVFSVGSAGIPLAYELPIKYPVRNTSTPPTIT
jgi:hypothetical protein